MNTFKFPSNISIIKYFAGIICLTIVFLTLDAIQSMLTNHSMDTFFNLFTDPIVFLLWTLYWLSTAFETPSFSSFKGLFEIPKNQKWYLEVLMLLSLNLLFSISIVILTTMLLVHYFPNIANESALPLLPQNQILASVCLLLTSISSVIIKPVLEELLFRGIFFAHLNISYSSIKAMIIVSALFAIFHMDPIGAFVFSITACILTIKYNSLFPSVILHIANNFICNVPMMIVQLNPIQQPSDASDFVFLPYSLGGLIFSSICLAIYFLKQKNITKN